MQDAKARLELLAETSRKIDNRYNPALLCFTLEDETLDQMIGRVLQCFSTCTVTNAASSWVYHDRSKHSLGGL